MSRFGAYSRVAVVAATIVLAIVFVAIADGVELPGTQPSDGSGAPGFPPFMNGSKEGTFDDAGNCSSCHGGYRNAGEPIYEPFDTWAGSMMAQASRDPLFWAAVDIANQDDAAHLGDVGIGDFCIRCHAPKAWYEGRSHCDTAWGEPFDGSCMDGTLDTDDNDFDGLSCHFCHRMYDASVPPSGEFHDAAAPYEENGQVYLDKTPKVMRGPYFDASPPGRHDFAGSEVHRSSAFCGQCHNVTNPALNRRDENTGADLGYLMPVERTYDEWLRSDYGDEASADFASCQRCHMPPPDLDGDGTTDPAFACGNPPGPRGEDTVLEGPIWTHGFAGGGVFMLEVLEGEYGAALNRIAEFDAAIEGARRLLQEKTATLELEVPADVPSGGVLDATALVTNLAGHKFPTGYPEGRRAWIHVEAGADADADGYLDDEEVSYENGYWDETNGELSHDPEPKVYETLVGIWNKNGTGSCDIVDDATGRKMFHFVLNDCVVKDNRIPPKGFVPDEETESVAYTYPEDPDRPGRVVHWDRTPYAIPVSGSSGQQMLVEATLYYQTTSREFIDFLELENTSTCDPFDSGCDPTLPNAGPNRGEKMASLWNAYGRSAPVEVASSYSSVPITSGGTPIPGEAADPRFESEQVLVTAYDDLTGELTISYGVACDATDHAIYWGPLSSVTSYGWDDASCSIGATGVATFDPGDRAVFFVLSGHGGSIEGSLGLTHAGSERPESGTDALCALPQDLGQTCMP